MTPEQALIILRDVGALHRGTLTDHQKIQQALETIAKLIAPEKEGDKA